MKITKIIDTITQGQQIKYKNIITDDNIQTLATDSRTITQTDGVLFFAIPTTKNDGIYYVKGLIRRGVHNFIVSDNDTQAVEILKKYQDVNIIVVHNTIQALQDIAAYKRSLCKGTIIGITGSNGKTVVKEWLYQLLKDDYNVVCSPKSYNSQIGVPLSVWELEPDTQIGIFEAGISQPGEMAQLQKIIQPTLGVITYIGSEHGENFASLVEKRAEKMLLFKDCPIVIEEPTHQNIRTCATVLRQLGYDETTIAHKLRIQTHETILQIDLRALITNVRYFRSLLKPTTKLVCMVKAFAYGTGCVPVSKALQDAGVADYLAVAVADEGVELRQAGITLPIIVMDPEIVAIDSIIENTLEPNIYSFSELESIVGELTRRGIVEYPVHIKVDSGMHRLGFYDEEIQRLGEYLLHQSAVKVLSVFSHLAGSDEQQFDDFTKQQINYFSTCADKLTDILPYHFDRHILNSAGIERFPQAQFDGCRLGIGMYGFSFIGKQLQNVCALKTIILSLKTVRAGETIGYGRHTTLNSDCQIAVIPIGYADGLDRRLSNYAGHVWVRGKECPIVGNICMDQAMVDVTGTDAKVGDQVIIFDSIERINALAEQLHTIPYEIITSISRRVKRVYI